MNVRSFLLSLFLVGFGLQTLAQQKKDCIYRLDKTFLEVVIDEVGDNEIIYFLPNDIQKKPQKIRKHEVWKLVFSNGDVEEINALSQQSRPQIPVSEEVISPLLQEEQTEKTPIQHRQRPQKYVSIFGSLVMSSFYRSELFLFPQQPMFNWDIGAAASLLSWRYYQMRFELAYATKGAREIFTDNSLRIKSENRLEYIQANFFPIILKTGSNRLNVAGGIGGYYAYLLNITSRYAIGDDALKDDDKTEQLFKKSPDYGIKALVGLYSQNAPLLELRYSYGLVPLMEQTVIKNHGINLAIFLTF